MGDSIHPRRRAGLPRARLLAAAGMATGILVAGCGGSSTGSNAAITGAATTNGSSAAGASATSSGATGASGTPNALAFAKCMRANGVPNFPDPAAGGGFVFSAAAINPAAPAVKAAQAKCRKFAPLPPGAGGSSSSPQDEAHALTQLRAVAQCMRVHGISAFPDPSSTRPANLSLGEYSEITDYEGVFLLFPATIDMQSPAWEQAAAACGPLAESFGHPHH